MSSFIKVPVTFLCSLFTVSAVADLTTSVVDRCNNNDFTLPKMQYVNDKRQTTKEYEKTENESISDIKSIDKGENIKSETENKNIRTANSKEDAFVQGSENKIVQISILFSAIGCICILNLFGVLYFELFIF
jgi:hypothetical protein